MISLYDIKLYFAHKIKTNDTTTKSKKNKIYKRALYTLKKEKEKFSKEEPLTTPCQIQETNGELFPTLFLNKNKTRYTYT